jgi:hypothetical protein
MDKLQIPNLLVSPPQLVVQDAVDLLSVELWREHPPPVRLAWDRSLGTLLVALETNPYNW